MNRYVARGRITRTHPRVYSIGHAPISRDAIWLAAVDAGGPGAVLSGFAAAELWGISRAPARAIDVLVPRRHEPIAGARVHATRSLDIEDVTQRRRVPVLRVERLLVELADGCTEGQLCALINEARHRRVLNRRRLGRVMRRHRNRVGHARLLRALAMLDSGSAGFRSRWEEQVAGRVAAPLEVMRLICTRTVIAGVSLEPDIRFPDLHLIVEIDGPDHDRESQRRQDESNDRKLASVGILVVRIHWSDEDGGVARANAEIERRCTELRRNTLDR
jgi:hypothetical protein